MPERIWASVLDVREEDKIPCVGTVLEVEVLPTVVVIHTNWHGAAAVEFPHDMELWIDRD